MDNFYCIVLGFNATFNSYGHIMAVSEAHVFPGFLRPVPIQLSFQSHRLLFSHDSEAGGEKKVCFNRISNSQPPFPKVFSKSLFIRVVKSLENCFFSFCHATERGERGRETESVIHCI